jgi:hypothetical protein
MATMGETTGNSATVTVAERVFVLSPITLREEDRLAKQWEAIARVDDAKRNAAAFRLIAANPDPEGRAEMNRELVREAKRGEPLSSYAVFVEARRTPKGVARDLFARTRATHPEVSLAEFEVILNEHNADEVSDGILSAMAEMNPKDQTP